MEIQSAESIANVGAKIAEIEAMRVELDRRLGSSSAQLEAIWWVAGIEAFIAQVELDEARRQTAEAGLAANTARLAEIQQAMTVAMKSLDQAAQGKLFLSSTTLTVSCASSARALRARAKGAVEVVSVEAAAPADTW